MQTAMSTKPLLILEPYYYTEEEIWSTVTPVVSLEITKGQERLGTLGPYDWNLWDRANTLEEWAKHARNGDLYTLIVTKVGDDLETLSQLTITVHGVNGEDIVLCVHTATLSTIMKNHGLLSKAILQRYPPPTAPDIGELKIEILPEYKKVFFKLVAPPGSSYAGLKLVEFHLGREDCELKDFFHWAEMSDYIGRSTPMQEARQRVRDQSSSRRTLAGRAMEWVRDVARWAGCKDVNLHDSWRDPRGNDLLESANARFKRMMLPRSFYRPYTPTGRLTQVKRAKFVDRVKKHGYYGMWNFENVAGQPFGKTVRTDMMRVLRAPFIDIAS